VRSQSNIAHVKANVSRIILPDTRITYTRTDEEVEASFFSNSTSSHYQLYRVTWEGDGSFLKTWFLDGVATREDGEKIVDPSWRAADFVSSGGCGARNNMENTISSTSHAVRTSSHMGSPLFRRLFWTGLVTIMMAGW
jgi:hypothetical protein